MIEITVIDAGPVIHLDESGCLDLLEGFGSVHLPPEVQNEIAIHRPRLNLEDLPGLKISPAKISPRVVSYARSLDLDTGEIAALSLLEKLHGQVFLCDDAAARLAAEAMGFKVHGTIGIILRAIRRGRRTPAEVREILEQIPVRSTLHLSRVLLRKVIESLPA
jgi:predicted nucleic acid-binding protein